MWWGVPSPQHPRELMWGDRGHLTNVILVGVKAVGAEVRFSSIVFQNRTEELRVEGEETKGKGRYLPIR